MSVLEEKIKLEMTRNAEKQLESEPNQHIQQLLRVKENVC